MSSFAVINVVTEVLKDLLDSSLMTAFGNGNSGSYVVLKSPKDLETGVPKGLSLFLYNIVENAYIKNQPMKRIDTTRLQYPPLALNCHYLLTPYGEEQANDGTGINTHRALGRAMQVLHDNAILKGPALMSRLENINEEDYYNLIEEIRIILNPLSLDDLTKLWNSLNTSLRLSASYEVRVIMIESERKEEVARIDEKEAHYYQKVKEEFVDEIRPYNH